MLMRKRPLLAAVSALVPAGALGFVIGQHIGRPWLCTLFSSSVAAAWMQGVGSLLAIVALVWVSIYQRRSQERSSRESSQTQARKIAHIIWPAYVDWLAKALRAATMHGAPFDNPNARILNEFLYLSAPQAFTVPTKILDQLDRIEHLEAAGESLLRALNVAAMGEERHRKLRNRPGENGEIRYSLNPDAANELRDVAKDLHKHLAAAGDEISYLRSLPFKSERAAVAAERLKKEPAST
jgi:hypothetical protein